MTPKDPNRWNRVTIRKLRADMGDMTQQQFATDLGVSISTVARWETGISHPRGLSVMILDQAGEEV